MKLMKSPMFLLLFLSSTAFASDKPVWAIDYKELNLPEHGDLVADRDKVKTMGLYDRANPHYKVQFTPDNKILISFLEYRNQRQLGSNAPPENFVVLLLSREKGELIRRVEWSIADEFVERATIGTRIYPLPSGGYVVLLNGYLQALDSSFNVIHSRVVEDWNIHNRLVEAVGRRGVYDIIVPLSGKFFILDVGYYLFERISEIIDADTFETIERFHLLPDFRIVDIWEGRLLSNSHSDSKGIRERHFFEKNIGASQWNDLVSIQGSYAEARFIHNGAIVATDFVGLVFGRDTKGTFFTIEDGRKGDSVFLPNYGFIEVSSSRSAPIVSIKRSHLSALRRFFDRSGRSWIESYDLSARQVLLKTKRHTDIVDYAISPDGDGILLMTKKKIEFYAVNPKKK